MAADQHQVEEFDFVIVGAGSSGCALAGRLAEDGRHSVAVIEAGRERRPKLTAIPAALVHTIGNPRYDWQYLSEPDPTRDGRIEPWPRGLGPGGSGLINGMIFVRGAPQDFDAWRDMGATGWGYRDVLPYFRRFETSEIAGEQSRGALGPQAIGALRYVHPVTRMFIESAVAAGIPFTPDYNGDAQEGVGFTQATQRNGRRHSPFDAFLEPAVRRGLVKLIQEARVLRVVMDGATATGVEYERDGVVRTVRARRQVVLSGGAINTPQILMLSGIGDPAALQAAGIHPLVDNAEVGANLMEHPGIFMRAEVDVPTLNQQATTLGKALAVLQWLAGRGPATTPTAQALAFLRSIDGMAEPDIQIHFTAFGFTGPGQTSPAERLISIVPSVNHPESRGSITLASPDPRAAPRIFPRLLEAEADIATLRRGLRICTEILAAGPLGRHVRRIVDNPPLEDGEEAERAFIRATALPLFHPVGTCRMGSDARAVVGPDLSVRGVERLAVADVSIMPRHISGNTHASALMIGERAADLLRRQ